MEELKEKLLALCNESGLPLEAILFVTKDLWRDVDNTFRLYKEQAEAQAKGSVSKVDDKEDVE